MKIAAVIARYLLGVVFVIFGLNGFLHFIPMGPAPTGPAGQFMGALIATNYMVPVFLVQLAAGVLFLAGQYVPLALTLIAPVIFNILLFHALMLPAGLPLAGIVLVLWIIVFAYFRPAFSGILQRQPV